MASSHIRLSLQEATIRNGAAQYLRTSSAALSARDTECAAFRSITHELETSTSGAPRVRAVGRNHTLWSLLLKDLALAENGLPEGVKTGLINLGLWSMRYSTLALLKDLSLQPLIDVNRNVLDGLVAQTQLTGSNQALAAPFSA